jgi:hypothetical protein
MFDNLRDSASASPFYEDDIKAASEEPAPTASSSPVQRSNARFLGMTAMQRFILALMLLFTVCVLGTLALFILGRMSVF